jgi:RNA binding exosome subunit
MINKFKKFKRNIIQTFAQTYANVLLKKLETEIDSDSFFTTFDQAAKLNAYCIVFHEIYLD